MSTALIQLARTTEIPTCSWKGSTCTTMKLQVTVLCGVQTFWFCRCSHFCSCISVSISRCFARSNILLSTRQIFQEENMFPELFLSIWNLAQWIQSDPALLDKSSDQTTSFSVSRSCIFNSIREFLCNVLKSVKLKLSSTTQMSALGINTRSATFHSRSIWSGKQLGKGALHWRSRIGRFRTRCRP